MVSLPVVLISVSSYFNCLWSYKSLFKLLNNYFMSKGLHVMRIKFSFKGI